VQREISEPKKQKVEPIRVGIGWTRSSNGKDNGCIQTFSKNDFGKRSLGRPARRWESVIKMIER